MFKTIIQLFKGTAALSGWFLCKWDNVTEVLEVAGLRLYDMQVLLYSTACTSCNGSHPYKQLTQW